MNRRELESQEIRYFWGFIPDDPANPYFIVAKRLQDEGLVAIGQYSVKNWRSMDNNLAVNATYHGRKAIQAVIATPEFAIVYQLAKYEGSHPSYIQSLLPTTKWGEDFKKRVEGTKLHQRAKYLIDLAAERARDKDKQWLYTEESQTEIRAEADEAMAKAEELLSGLLLITAEEFPLILENLIRKSINSS